MLPFLLICFGIVCFCIWISFKREDRKEQEKVVDIIELSPYEMLERQTYLRALQGDKSARDWLMKHTFKEEADNLKVTKKNVIDDAVMAMVSVGYQKSEANKIIKSLVSHKYYNTAEELFTDASTKRHC